MRVSLSLLLVTLGLPGDGGLRARLRDPWSAREASLCGDFWGKSSLEASELLPKFAQCDSEMPSLT